MFKELAETDAVQDSLFGEDRRGDELPEDLSHPRTRFGRPTTRQNVTGWRRP